MIADSEVEISGDINIYSGRNLMNYTKTKNT